MSKSEHLLVDVIRLSQKSCKYPIRGELAYATRENFLGRIVNGYHPDAIDVCLMSKNAAAMLCKAQHKLNEQNLGLFIFDSYRPLRAVKDFMHWFDQPPANAYELERKQIHYPHLEKNQLSAHGYVASDVSKHCFGATVDLTLINLTTGKELNMGACFDYFDEISHSTVTPDVIGSEAFNNRQILSQVMQEFGFKTYKEEFWHFDGEREIHDPLDIEITAELRGFGVD